MTSVPSTLVLLLAIAVMAFAAGVEKELTFENRLEHLNWVDYKTTFGKSYENKATDLDRMLTFLRNKELIRKHNLEYAQGKRTHWLSLNKFADMKPTEMKKLNGFNQKMAEKSLGKAVKFSEHVGVSSNLQLSAHVDWRDMGLVSEVKDQGQCGSCWAFSATGSLEGQNMRKFGQLVSLSEQNIVDCAREPMYLADGCDGGFMNSAFQYVIDNYGVDIEYAYPYSAKDGPCRFSRRNVGGNAKGFVTIDKNDESQLKFAVATQGPISVAIDAEFDFMFYGGGVYKSDDCSAYYLNHGVLAVGYGEDEKAGNYWIVKNSWGGDWGEKGYIRMVRNNTNICGIAAMASYPIV